MPITFKIEIISFFSAYKFKLNIIMNKIKENISQKKLTKNLSNGAETLNQ